MRRVPTACHPPRCQRTRPTGRCPCPHLPLLLQDSAPTLPPPAKTLSQLGELRAGGRRGFRHTSCPCILQCLPPPLGSLTSGDGGEGLTAGPGAPGGAAALPPTFHSGARAGSGCTLIKCVDSPPPPRLLLPEPQGCAQCLGWDSCTCVGPAPNPRGTCWWCGGVSGRPVPLSPSSPRALPAPGLSLFL